MQSKYAKERQDLRMKDYKNSFSANDFKNRREESLISIRKQKREDNIQKRRNMEMLEDDEKTDDISITKIPLFCEHLKSSDTQLQIEGAIGIRKLLSLETNPPIDEVISTGIIPILICCLNRNDSPKLQFESSWALTNIASGSSQQTLFLIQNNAVPAFINQLQSTMDVSVREQAIWALGNIAGDSYQSRDYVLKHNVLMRLLPLTSSENKPSLRRNAVWAISNLCRGKPAPLFSSVSPAIPILATLISSPDIHIISDACWALSYLCDGDNVKIQAILDANICSIAVRLLNHPSSIVQIPALRIIGNIVTGDDIQTQTAIECGVLNAFKELLDRADIKSTIKKEVCWALSNITAGTLNQIQSVIESNLFHSLLYLLGNAEFEIKKEAIWAIANATSSASHPQIDYIVKLGCLRPLCELLTINDARMILVTLEGLENILTHGEKEKALTGDNPYSLAIEDINGVEKIERLQMHSNQQIFEKSSHIIEKYFGGGDDDENEDFESDEEDDGNGDGTFQFGTTRTDFSFNN